MAGANGIGLGTQTCRDEKLGVITSPRGFVQLLLVPGHISHHVITKWKGAMKDRCNPKLIGLMNEKIRHGTRQRLGRQQSGYSVLS